MNNNGDVLNVKRVIRIKPISPTTINHILAMLKITYIRDKIVEHSITQKHISILTNIQLMCLITTR